MFFYIISPPEENEFFNSAKERWLNKAATEPPINSSSQKEWDMPICKQIFDLLLSTAQTEKDKARLASNPLRILDSMYTKRPKPLF